jgi:succinyl-diaminopimelate desuccinylase
MNESPTLALARQLIQRPSVTPLDGDCQQIMRERLERLGFECESLRFDDVDNLWAVRGSQGPLFVFAGHTDVVPVGSESDWSHPPFAAEVDGDYLHGRGAADMKGSLAAMITACEAALTGPEAGLFETLRLGFLITSDEEGIAKHGTRRVMETLNQRGEKIDYCLVGEPSSDKRLGDTIRIGRRGSLSAKLKVKGVQGHVAYPQLAVNPIHKAMPALAQLSAENWDAGNEAFPPTTLQISNIAAGTGANNVIPPVCEVDFNFRFSTESCHEDLKSRAQAIFAANGLNFDIDWHLSGEPFLTQPGLLRDAITRTIREHTGLDTDQSTAGGTSDGRFIAPSGAEVVELGPRNATIHQVDECVAIADIEKLSELYAGVIHFIAKKFATQLSG